MRTTYIDKSLIIAAVWNAHWNVSEAHVQWPKLIKRHDENKDDTANINIDTNITYKHKINNQLIAKKIQKYTMICKTLDITHKWKWINENLHDY